VFWAISTQGNEGELWRAVLPVALTALAVLAVDRHRSNGSESDVVAPPILPLRSTG